MFFRLVNTQAIQAMVNIDSIVSSPSPLVAIALASTPSLTLAREASTPDIEVDQFMYSVKTLTMKEPTLPPASTKRAQNWEQLSPWDKVSPKRTRVD